MARPNLYPDARNSNYTMPLSAKRKLAALGYDNNLSSSQMLVKLVEEQRPKPTPESSMRAEREIK